MEKNVNTEDVLAFIGLCDNPKVLTAVRDKAVKRLHEIEHKDTPPTGYKSVTVPGAKRQP